MNEKNLSEMFGWTAGEALSQTESKSNSGSGDNYKPKFNDPKSKDLTYSALIRFMPFFYENKRCSVIERWESFLTDVNRENGFYVVSPKTVGKSCPIKNLSWKLFSSGNAADKENSKLLNVSQRWYSLIEVVRDPQHPEYEGKFFIFPMGSKIHDKLVDAEKGSEYSDPINPFDFGNAPLFEIKLTKSAQKVNGRDTNNYDACRFIDKKAPIHFGNGQTLTETAESRMAYLEWLDKEAPKINSYRYKEWDHETEEKVNANLATFTSGYVAPRSTAAKANETLETLQGANSSSSVATPVIPQTPAVNPTVTTDEPDYSAPEETSNASSSGDDAWVDSILNN